MVWLFWSVFGIHRAGCRRGKYKHVLATARLTGSFDLVFWSTFNDNSCAAIRPVPTRLSVVVKHFRILAAVRSGPTRPMSENVAQVKTCRKPVLYVKYGPLKISLYFIYFQAFCFNRTIMYHSKVYYSDHLKAIKSIWEIIFKFRRIWKLKKRKIEKHFDVHAL